MLAVGCCTFANVAQFLRFSCASARGKLAYASCCCGTRSSRWRTANTHTIARTAVRWWLTRIQACPAHVRITSMLSDGEQPLHAIR
jgi:hypothetical protein